MFKTFITDSNYVGTNEGSSCPNITGIMYVANETPVDELWIRNTLVTKFPQLTVFFKNVTPANSARFILQEDDGTWKYVPNKDINNTEPSVQKIADGDTFDMISFSYGVGCDILSLLCAFEGKVNLRDDLVAGGIIGGKIFALPWAFGGYTLCAFDDVLAKTDGVLSLQNEDVVQT